MSWRKWLVRGLVYSVLTGLGSLFLVFYLYTNPAATRKTVLDILAEKFSRATVSLQSARLNLLDGISLSDLRMARRDDIDQIDFLYVPSAVIYHDKEQLLAGKLALRKIVLNRPQLRILLDRNGRCNLTGLLPPCDLSERMPTLIMQQGTILIEDRRLVVGKPILEVRNVNMTILNDPLPTLHIEGTGQTDVLGPLQVRAETQRVDGAFSSHLELPAIPIGPVLVQRLSEFLPDLASQMQQFQAQAKVQLSTSYQASASPPLGLTLNCQLSKGYLIHARLPFPLEDIEASLNLVNDPVPADPPPPLAGGRPASPPTDAATSPGPTPLQLRLRVPAAMLTASAGPTRLEGNIKDLILPRLDQHPSNSKTESRPRPPGPPGRLGGGPTLAPAPPPKETPTRGGPGGHFGGGLAPPKEPPRPGRSSPMANGPHGSLPGR